MNFKKLALGIAVVATLASCAKKEEGVDVVKFNNISLKISGADAPTRAITDVHTAAQLTPRVNTAVLNLFDASSSVGTKTLTTDDISKATSPAGLVVSVASAAKNVAMVANIIKLQGVLRDYQVAKPINELPLRSGKAAITVVDGKGEATISDLKPAVARLEIKGKIEGTGYAYIKIKEIYINNLYNNFDLNTGVSSDKKYITNQQLNTWKLEYAAGQALDKMYTNSGFSAQTGHSSTGAIPDGKVDAYNIFPTLTTADDDTPHVVLVFDALIKNQGNDKVKTDRVLTVKKFVDENGAAISEFEAGKVYTLNLADLNDYFKENPHDPNNPDDPSEDEPEKDKIELTVKVTVQNWTEATIKPVI